MVKYNFSDSPDGLQVEKETEGEWIEDVHGAPQEYEEKLKQVTQAAIEHEKAHLEERELGLTQVSEAEGKKLLKLLTAAESWET